MKGKGEGEEKGNRSVAYIQVPVVVLLIQLEPTRHDVFPTEGEKKR